MHRVDILDHHVGDVEIRRLVAWLEREVQLCRVALQDHEADGVAVLEGFPEAEGTDIEIAGAGHVGHGQHRGDPPEAERGNRISHRKSLAGIVPRRETVPGNAAA